MASKKKESTGIALLSMYNDEDEEMEDLNEEEQEEEEMDEDRDDDKDANRLDEELKNKDNEGFFASSDNTPQALEDDWSPNAGKFGSLTPQQAQFNASSPMRRRGTVTIVDYGHDEVAMSPEAEEGEIVSSGLDADVQTANGDLQEKLAAGTGQTLNTQATQSSGKLDILQTARMNYAVSGLEVAEVEFGVELALEVSKDVDPLAKFLPPPPEEKCSDELQERINKFLALKRAGKSFNAEVRNKKDYRNPDFLVHAVRYQDIDQIGSCFSKDVFDPHGYDKSDYYDEIEADMKLEIERKEQEKKKSQKVEFIAVGTQPGIVTAPPKISVPISGVTTGSTGGLHSVATAADAVARDGRQNKKSKWDKVDGDRRNPLPSGAQDSISTVGAHAAILSAANAGAGYTAFAQQRRREAEEKKSSERRRT